MQPQLAFVNTFSRPRIFIYFLFLVLFWFSLCCGVLFLVLLALSCVRCLCKLCFFCVVCCLLRAPLRVSWAFVLGRSLHSFFVGSLVTANVAKKIQATLLLLDGVLSVWGSEKGQPWKRSKFGGQIWSANLSVNHVEEMKRGGAFLLTVEVFLLTVELLCLQSLKALIRRTFPL